MRDWLLIVAVIFFLATSAIAKPSVWSNSETPSKSSDSHYKSSFPKMFFGGGLSIGLGDVEYYDIQPLIGVQLSRQISSGVSLLYRYRKDKRYTPTLTTEDYGASLFGRYNIVPNIFLHGEYEYLNHEYYRADLTTARQDYNSFLAGAGVSQPLGGRGSAYASVLYNFTYDESNSPYDTPWVYRFGVSFGF